MFLIYMKEQLKQESIKIGSNEQGNIIALENSKKNILFFVTCSSMD